MAYTRTRWEESATPLSAENMNNIEDGIEEALAFGRNETIDLMQPIGSLYLTTSSTNPNLTFGRGTWVLFGSGRVPVCVDTTKTEFDRAEKTGGESVHSHTNPTTGSTALTIEQIPPHTHGYETGFGVTGGSGTTSSFRNKSTAQTESAGGGQGHTHTMGNTGEASSMMPYITCYIWKRIG